MAKSNRSTSSKSKNKSKAIDRPFDPLILRKARSIAERYNIVIHFEDGEYFGRSLEFPYVMNDGKTPAECIEKTIDILTTTVAAILEEGHAPPSPASDDRRDQQVNVRLSEFEKAVFEEAARSQGFRGVSDFMRATTLASVR